MNFPLVLACVLFGVLAGCSQATPPPEKNPRIAVIRLLDKEGEFRLFIGDASGLRPVLVIGDEIRELRALNHNMVAVETRFRGKRLLNIVNLASGKRKTPYGLDKGEAFPVLNNDGSQLLTIRQRRDRYAIELVTIAPPYKPIKDIAYWKVDLSPLAWPCGGGTAYFFERETAGSRVIRFNLETGNLTDVTPKDLAGHEILWFSASCDGRIIAASASPPGDVSNYNLHIYRNGARIKVIRKRNAIEPDVASNGSAVVYVEGYGKPKNRIMKYDLATGRSIELIGPVSAFAGPVFLD